ncbi:hypothetical protein ZIOFF_063011 [Zingiber officinale]|uniref:RING-type domain-containing protein n=1 Tax=Zingiber officinale TaxID=94328 RepID=A0A8J5K9K7_ZINOF|nr:hypothetical protein ZIOFF_063011 [Zingiber officinale]
MAVQAVGFSDFGSRSMEVYGSVADRSGFGVFRAVDELQMSQQDPGNLLWLGVNLGVGKQQQSAQEISTDPRMVGEWQSDLACNGSVYGDLGPVKSLVLPGRNHPATSPVLPLPGAATDSVKVTGAVPGILPQSRLPETGTPSTSGRPASTLPPVSSSTRDLISVLYQQSQEIGAFVRLQNERMQGGLLEMFNRHSRSVLSVLRQQATMRLMEKEADLQRAIRRNAELEEKVRQMSNENQFWFNMAKNNEAIARSLQLNLEQALHQGDLSDHKVTLQADDAHSCCYEEGSSAAVPAADAGRTKLCKTCGVRGISILLLPCRHLCLCQHCASHAVACPVCGVTLSNFLEVFLCR